MLQQKVIDEVASAIEGTMKNFAQNGAFVRLSSRSPKDTLGLVLSFLPHWTFLNLYQRLYELYLSEVEKAVKEGMERNAVTEKIAFTRANGKVLRVTSGKEAVQLFLSSQRIHEDLNMAWYFFLSNAFIFFFFIINWFCL